MRGINECHIQRWQHASQLSKFSPFKFVFSTFSIVAKIGQSSLFARSSEFSAAPSQHVFVKDADFIWEEVTKETG